MARVSLEGFFLEDALEYSSPGLRDTASELQSKLEGLDDSNGKAGRDVFVDVCISFFSNRSNLSNEAFKLNGCQDEMSIA